jgi:hypothetical protein
MSLWRYGWWLDGHPSVRLVASSGATELPAGGYYWEVTLVTGGVGQSAGFGVAAGVANASMTLTETVDAGLNLAQANSQFANFWTSKVDTAGGTPTWGYPARPSVAAQRVATANGDKWGIAVNTTTHRLWWRRLTGANTDWNVSGTANPATGVGGQDISSGGDSPVTGSLFAICGADMGDNPLNTFTSPGVGTANFGTSAFTGAAPTGFVSPRSLLPASVCTLNPSDKSARITLSGGNLTFTNNFDPGAGNGDKYSMVRSIFSIAQA